jgi:DNA replication protein DnaC
VDVCVDDLSYVRRDQAETSVLFERIAERYEYKSLAITANTRFSQWGDAVASRGRVPRQPLI